MVQNPHREDRIKDRLRRQIIDPQRQKVNVWIGMKMLNRQKLIKEQIQQKMLGNSLWEQLSCKKMLKAARVF